MPGTGLSAPHVGNQVYANPHQHCVMKVNSPTLPPCNGNDANQNGWFEIIRYPAILENGTRLIWEGKGYHQPKFLWVTYDIMEYQAGPDAVTKKEYDLKWGDSVDFALPDGFTRYRIDGQSITFQNISLSGGKASPLLQFEEVSPAPNSVATYHVKSRRQAEATSMGGHRIVGSNSGPARRAVRLNRRWHVGRQGRLPSSAGYRRSGIALALTRPAKGVRSSLPGRGFEHPALPVAAAMDRAFRTLGNSSRHTPTCGGPVLTAKTTMEPAGTTRLKREGDRDVTSTLASGRMIRQWAGIALLVG